MAYRNKEDQAAASKRHYEKNKDKVKKRSYKRNVNQRQRNREYIAGVKGNSKCVDCGESNPLVLEFDHVIGEKIGNISDMCHSCCSIETIQKEIDKCEVRCANCHRIQTHNRRTTTTL